MNGAAITCCNPLTMIQHKISVFLATGVLFIGLSDGFRRPQVASSQDLSFPQSFPPPPPGTTVPTVPSASEQRLERLREQQRLIEAEKALLQQQIELTRLKGTVIAPTTDATRPLPSSETTTQQGNFQTVESRILAYEAMNKVAGAIYEDIKEIDDINALIIYDQEIFSTITAYRLLKVKIKEFQRRYADLGIRVRPPARPGSRTRGGITDLSPLGLPTTFTRSVLEFVALFRSRDQITFEPDFKLNPNSLIAAIASRFQEEKQSVKVYNPGFYLMSLDSIDDSSLAGIVGTDFASIIDLRSKASATFGGQELRVLNEEVDAFLQSLLFSEGKSDPYGNPPLLAIIQANQLEKILNDSGSYVLHLDIDVAGGSHRTRSSLFTTMFSGKRISFSGGSVVNYSLFARDGSLKRSDFYYYNTGYKGMKGRKTNIRK